MQWLPHGPIINYEEEQYEILGYVHGKIAIAKPFTSIAKHIDIEDCQLYLRPMSSMTEEEKQELGEIALKSNVSSTIFGILGSLIEVIDFFNAHRFDYRNLIDKGLAIEVTENNNPYKN